MAWCGRDVVVAGAAPSVVLMVVTGAFMGVLPLCGAAQALNNNLLYDDGDIA
jgi:hypothetical protein